MEAPAQPLLQEPSRDSLVARSLSLASLASLKLGTASYKKSTNHETQATLHYYTTRALWYNPGNLRAPCVSFSI